MSRATWGGIGVALAVAAIVFSVAALCDLDAARPPAFISVFACIAWGFAEPKT